MITMNGYKHLAKIREYCDYIEEHLKNVEWAWSVLKEKCEDMHFVWDDHLYWWVNELVKQHDVSKFSAEEFIPYCFKFYPIVDDVAEEAFAAAWEHHKKENPHHWENWTSAKYYNPYEAEVHCVCMVIDWMAMGKKFGDTAQLYYEKNKDRIKLPDWAVKFIYEIFERIQNAEDAKGAERGG